MNPTEPVKAAIQPGLVRCGLRWWFAVGVVCIACGSHGLRGAGGDAGAGAAGSPGGGASSAGMGGTGSTGRGGASGSGGTVGGTGGVLVQGGTHGGGEDGGVGDRGVVEPPDSFCDVRRLQQAATQGGFVLCVMFVDGGSFGLPLVGEVVLDADGRVIDNTRLYGKAKESWLSRLANDRWPCLAGQTIPYYCDRLY